MRQTKITINLPTLKQNIKNLKELIPNSKTQLSAVVKANAYGHGAVNIAKKALESGCTSLAVAFVSEALELRKVGIKAPIFILGLINPDEAKVCVYNDIIVTVCTLNHLEILQKSARSIGKKALISIAVDTGMNRIGANESEVFELLKAAKDMPEIDTISMFTHFSSADDEDLSYANLQEERFDKIINTSETLSLRPPIISACASAAMLTKPKSHYDMVRLGISMYGIAPSKFLKEKIKVEPILTLSTKISFLKKVPSNTPISYGLTYYTKKPALIATLPIGYGDGYNRKLSNKSNVIINNKKYPSVGTICMDQMMIELDQNDNVKVNDDVILIGRSESESITFDDLAEKIDTISYELVCNLSLRIPRIYIE